MFVLKLKLENNLISSIEFDLSKLVSLDSLELDLHNNYIDNIRFEIVLENLELMGVAVRYVPPGGHHEMGQIESNNWFWRNMLNRIIDNRALYTDFDIDCAILSCDFAKNSLLKKCGRSPYSAVFGRAPSQE